MTSVFSIVANWIFSPSKRAMHSPKDLKRKHRGAFQTYLSYSVLDTGGEKGYGGCLHLRFRNAHGAHLAVWYWSLYSVRNEDLFSRHPLPQIMRKCHYVADVRAVLVILLAFSFRSPFGQLRSWTLKISHSSRLNRLIASRFSDGLLIFSDRSH